MNETAFRLHTEHPLAALSSDTLHPHGSRIVNSRCVRWNQKVFALLGGYERVLHILDLGCAGGGWVRDCWEWGHIAAGIDGSDWSKRFRRSEWAVIPEYLFTADITQPFRLEFSQQPFQCDLITCWDTLEHIPQKDLAAVFANVTSHLKPGGLFICTVETHTYVRQGITYHETVEPITWWVGVMRAAGLSRLPRLESYFAGHYVRGPKHPIGGGTPLVLCCQPEQAPQPPQETLLRMALDRWLGSLPQRCLKYLLCGPDTEHR